MNTACSGGSDGVATRRNKAVLGASHALALAAAPTFAMMALLTFALGDGPMNMMCAAGPMTALNGMGTMYLLMSAFHVSPWLKLISGRRNGTP